MENLSLEEAGSTSSSFSAEGAGFHRPRQRLGKKVAPHSSPERAALAETTFVLSRVLPVWVLQCRPFRARLLYFPNFPGLARGFVIVPFQGDVSER